MNAFVHLWENFARLIRRHDGIHQLAGFLWSEVTLPHRLGSGGVGHGSRERIRPIKCRFSRSNGGHIFRCELRPGCRFSTDFCARHENRTNIFWELLVQYLGQLFGNSQWQVSIFCINFSQWKSYYVENVCLSSMLDMDIFLVVCGISGISILDYFFVKL